MIIPDVSIRTTVRALALCGAAISLSGCLGAAIAVPLATTAGMTAASNSAVDKTVSHATRVHRMNCNQLRAEHRKLRKNTLARVNPLGHWSGRMAAVRSAASNRGCRLPQ